MSKIISKLKAFLGFLIHYIFRNIIWLTAAVIIIKITTNIVAVFFGILIIVFFYNSYAKFTKEPSLCFHDNTTIWEKLRKKEFTKIDWLFYIIVIIGLSISCFASAKGIQEAFGINNYLCFFYSLLLSLSLMWILDSIKERRFNIVYLILLFLLIDVLSAFVFNWFYFYESAKEERQFSYRLNQLPKINDDILEVFLGKNDLYSDSLNVVNTKFKRCESILDNLENNKKYAIENFPENKVINTRVYNPNTNQYENQRTYPNYQQRKNAQKDLDIINNRIKTYNDSIRVYGDLSAKYQREVNSTQNDSIRKQLSDRINNLKLATDEEKQKLVPQLSEKLLELSVIDEELSGITDKLYFEDETPITSIQELAVLIKKSFVKSFIKEEFRPNEKVSNIKLTGNAYWDENKEGVMWFSLFVSVLIDLIPFVLSIIISFSSKKK